MRTLLLGAFLAMTVTVSQAIPVTFVVTAPTDTPVAGSVYLAGDFQGWQPGDPDWQLVPQTDGTFALTCDIARGRGLQFKFTGGSWLTVEKGPTGGEIANRLHVVSGPDTLRLTIAAWADGEPVVRPRTITGDVETWSLPEFLDGRRVWVYLPPGYTDEPSRRYPVLYMFDGQNVFDDATSFVGEWQVDETLEVAIPGGRVEPLIVVAVDHGGERRLREYTPWPMPHRNGSGGGRDHLRAWVDVLVPHINERYRTLTDSAHTGLTGSSLGGLMSLYGGFAYPDIFGKVGAFSPSLLIAGPPVFDFCGHQPSGPALIYADMGGREGGNLTDADHDGVDDYITALRRLGTLLSGLGYVGGWDLMIVEDEGARHNEQAWARRFPAAVEFLFPAE